MEKLLKYTYLMEVKQIDKQLKYLWGRYQKLLIKSSWADLNEARAILYLVGQIYCETIAPQAIERRLHLLKKPLKLNEFLIAVDSKSPQLKAYRRDGLFSDLEKFYILVKKFKNKEAGGRYYLGEEKFIKLYNRYNPDKKLKIGWRGKF